jgi:penicillin-binding protein 1C
MPNGLAARGTPLHIVFPPNGASLELSSLAGGPADPLAIKVAGGTPPVSLLLNGLPVAPISRGRRELLFAPEGPGFVRLTVTDALGAADSVLVRLQ